MTYWINSLVERTDCEQIYYDFREKGPATLVSTAWRGEKSGFYRARTCIFEAKDKFRAETLVIYPCVGHFLPVFGCEYIELPKRSLAVIDFHPIDGNLSPIMGVLSSQPNREVEKSVHYDLQEFFSPKMWHERGGKEVYGNFQVACELYIHLYYTLLQKNSPLDIDYPSTHKKYNGYMGANDPAHGILRGYFDQEFADDYIREFLFRA